MDSKHWYLSKTLWMAGGTLVVGVLKNIGIVEISDAELEQFVDNVLPSIMFGLIIVDRFLPKKKLTK